MMRGFKSNYGYIYAKELQLVRENTDKDKLFSDLEIKLGMESFKLASSIKMTHFLFLLLEWLEKNFPFNKHKGNFNNVCKSKQEIDLD